MALIDEKGGKPPAFQLYAADFLVDENVVLMSNQQAGIYIKLICYCWREGSIPDEPTSIAKLCGEDGSAMTDLWPAIRRCFASAPDLPGRLVHERLKKQREDLIAFKQNRSESGIKGAKARWGKDLGAAGSANATATGSAKSKPVAKNGSSSSSSEDTPNPLKGAGRFDEFWLIWPAGERKQDKVKCVDHWKRNHLDDHADAILADVAVKKQTQKWQEGYVEAPLVYLRGKRWLDGVQPQQGQGGKAKEWWETQSGIRLKGDQLRVPYSAGMASGGAWLKYVARVWIAAGDGPHWDETSPAYPIARELRGAAGANVRELVAAAVNKS